MSNKIYYNRMQREVMWIGANTSVIVAGRGTGKGVLHAGVNLRNVQAMPRATGGVIAPNAKRAKTNTLPSMFEHWEKWGFKRDVHWCVGHRPPKNFDWPRPLIAPDNYDDIICTYTGAIMQIVSQDRAGTSNSKSFDWLDIDEAKYIKFEQLKNETFPANRGQVREFGHCPWHHGMLITCDMPLTQEGKWFLAYENKMDKELVKVLEGLAYEIGRINTRLRTEDKPPVYLHQRLIDLRKLQAQLQRQCTFFRSYSSLTNLEVLGIDFIKQQKRDLPPLIFQTSILCIPVEYLQDGFYNCMRPKHKYKSVDFHYLDSLGYLNKPLTPDCRLDADVQQDRPLCIAFDYNSNINWMVVGQPDEENRRINVLKSFFVKYERKLNELCEDFDAYYKYFHRREVIFYYDATALGSNYAVNKEDFKWVISHKLRVLGWNVREVYIGKPMNHIEKHLLINRAFAGQASLTPYINEDNNEYLLVSIQSAGVYNGKKDKRGEKLAETEEDKLEARTDGSDAFDTLVIGCIKFPQRTFLIDTGDILV